MKLEVSSPAADDLTFWATASPKVLAKVIRLMRETMRTPRRGTGKPERIVYPGKEVWSRRINEKDRFTYEIRDATVVVLTCRHHYDDH